MLTPHMNDAELACYERLLRSASFLVEYGAGGSTLLAVEAGVRRILSIETDKEWLARLRQEDPISEAEASGRLQLRLVDIGPVTAWGRPAGKDRAHAWPAYARAPWPWFRLGPKPDLVLVDGRFRVASAACSVGRISREGRIVVHDFWSRPEYHVLLRILDCVERVDTLAVFRPNAHASRADRQRLISEYEYSPN